MRDYRITVRLLSPVGTPWQSDTVFGHLAWHIAHGRGGIDVADFLRPFRQGRPPFVLSDAFPDGLLPRPYLSVPLPEEPSIEAFQAARARQKAAYVSLADFDAIRRGGDAEWQPAPNPWARVEMLHASLNRFTGTTTGPGGDPEGGNLFPTYLTTLAIPRDQPQLLALYLRADDDWAQRVPELLSDMAPLGFGRDRSIGTGAYEVASVEPFDGFCDLPDANGFVSLSSYCPARDDPTNGRWRIRIKYGKLGENAGAGNPFKRPLVQLEPGAVFYTGGPPRPFYGRAVTDIAPGMPEAIQCCYTLAVPCLLPDAAAEVGAW